MGRAFCPPCPHPRRLDPQFFDCCRESCSDCFDLGLEPQSASRLHAQARHLSGEDLAHISRHLPSTEHVRSCRILNLWPDQLTCYLQASSHNLLNASYIFDPHCAPRFRSLLSSPPTRWQSPGRWRRDATKGGMPLWAAASGSGPQVRNETVSRRSPWRGRRPVRQSPSTGRYPCRRVPRRRRGWGSWQAVRRQAPCVPQG